MPPEYRADERIDDKWLTRHAEQPGDEGGCAANRTKEARKKQRLATMVNKEKGRQPCQFTLATKSSGFEKAGPELPSQPETETVAQKGSYNCTDDDRRKGAGSVVGKKAEQDSQGAARYDKPSQWDRLEECNQQNKQVE